MGNAYRKKSPGSTCRKHGIPKTKCAWKWYIREELLANGGFSSVYRARPTTNKPVDKNLPPFSSDQSYLAIKVIPKRYEDVFVNEIEIMRKLSNHKNIISLRDAFEDKKNFYVITELCDGGELFDRLLNVSSQYNEVSASKMFKQMLSAVQHVHSMNIAHLDLKPENFVFDSVEEGSKIKLIDFGSSKFVEDKEVLYSSFFGSFLYASPEILGAYARCSSSVLMATDMWAMGVILFSMVTGKSPFLRKHEPKIKESIFNADFSYPGDIELSDSVKDLIEKLLVVDAEERLTTEEALNHPWIKEPRQLSVVGFNPIVLSGMLNLQMQSALKRTLARFIAKKIPDYEKLAMKKLFDRYDRDSSGYLENDEIVEMLMKGLGMEREEALSQAQKLIEELDVRRQGGIDKEAFAEVHTLGSLSMDQGAIIETFRILDKNNDGNISLSELDILFEEEQEESLLQQMIDEADVDGDGKIQLDEFILLMMRSCPEDILKSIQQRVASKAFS